MGESVLWGGMKIRGLRIWNESGLSLIELLIVMAILGIVIGGLDQLMGSALSFHSETKKRQDLLSQANFAMERMVMFVREAKEIKVPKSSAFEVPERVLDTYDNITRTYLVEGDGMADADSDVDGLVDEGDGDDREWVKFERVGSSLQIIEKLPDRSTVDQADYLADRVICEDVTLFKCTKMANNLLEIELNLAQGANEVKLKTRVKARFVQ